MIVSPYQGQQEKATATIPGGSGQARGDEPQSRWGGRVLRGDRAVLACDRNRVHGLSATLAALLALPSSVAPVPCGDEPRVTLSAAEPVQGGVVLVEVSAAAAEDALTASWAGRDVRFWREQPEQPLRALVGIDLDHPTGPTALVLMRRGAPPCRVTVAVRAGSFPVEQLKVSRRFVELSPRDLARVRKEARRLRALYRRATPERLWRGAFAPPLLATPPSDNFGRKRILNDEPRSPHSGVDFAADPGTPVLAAQRGRVVLSAPLFFSGRTVILDHGLGLFSSYAHLRELGVKEGELVERGAWLGGVGATGRVTGPHLHWAMRLNEARVNPLDVLTLF